MASLLSNPKQGQVLPRSLRRVIVVIFLMGMLINRASATEINYSGHYDLAKAKSGRIFSLEVQQIGHKAKIYFFAAMQNCTDVSPYGVGTGRLEDGHLSFAFKDNFNNEGTCTLEASNDGYHLNMTLTSLVDARSVHYYGNLLLKKSADM